MVDDLKANLIAMRAILSKASAEIVMANSGEEALSLALHHEFALILMDVQMPRMDGFETASLLSQYEATEQVPIIFVTALSQDDSHIYTGYEVGAVDYLFKPLNSHVVLAKVRIFLELYKNRRDLEVTCAKLATEKEQRERVELELRLAQRLEAVGQLAAGIAHEINTPIQYVSDSIHFLREAFEDLSGVLAVHEALAAATQELPALTALRADLEKAKEEADLEYLAEQTPLAFDRVLDGIERVSTIVKSMKEFGRADTGSKEPADLNRAIENTLMIARSEYKYVADIKTELGDLPLVTCNIGEINQVLLNLIVNAAHAIGDVVGQTDQRGLIQIETRHEGDQAVIQIRDSGGGIPDEVADRVFEPFFTTKDVGSGTGQGLAIARSIVVERHGGNLHFETEAKGGTTFFIRLPVSDEAEQAAGVG